MSAIRLPDLSKLHAKTVVRCECKLVQFQTGETCRRCKLPFEVVEEAAPVPVLAEILPFRKVAKVSAGEQMSVAVLLLRTAHGWSQRDLAKRLGSPRTWITKLEHGHGYGKFDSFHRLAAAFEMTPYGLMLIAEVIQ